MRRLHIGTLCAAAAAVCMQSSSPAFTVPAEAIPETYAAEEPACGPDRPVDTEILMERYIEAFIIVESGGDDSAVGDCDDVGCLQITPVLVEDCNRILGRERFTLDDRLDRESSKEMFRVIQRHYNGGMSLVTAARRWNPGAGDWYYERVREALEDIAI